MKIRGFLSILAAICCSSVTHVEAAPFKTYISEFKVSSADTSTDLPVMLQRMLASRLNPGQVQLVDVKNQAELLISGSYATFGKMFSIDLSLYNTVSGKRTSLFEQGSGQDDIIPAMGRVAHKVDAAIALYPPVQLPQPLQPLTPPATQTLPLTPVAAPSVSSALRQTGGYSIKTPDLVAAAPSQSWESAPLEGVYSSLSVGQVRTTGEKEVFIANTGTVVMYLKGAELVKQDSSTVGLPAKILSMDTADTDRDGKTELYVTILDRNTLVSRIYTVEGSSLKLTASNLPWLFRGIGSTLQTRTIYIQKMGLRGEYLDGVAELVKKGTRFEAGAALKLPRFGTVYRFNRIQDAKGNHFFVVLDQDGYLRVSTAQGDEVWKSADKFGGSETFFVHTGFTHLRSTREKDQQSFLEQRLTVLPDGALLVPANTGGFNIGNNRNYGKHAFYAFQWTGSMFKEVWHTQYSPSYLADYAYIPDEHALLLLEVTQKPGLSTKGKTILSIKNVE